MNAAFRTGILRSAICWLLLYSNTALGESFSLLTYNVRGLPPLLESRAQHVSAIADRVSGYDVVLLQEVFAYDRHIVDIAQPHLAFAGPGPRFDVNHTLAMLVGYLPCRFSSFCQLPLSAGLSILIFNDSVHGEVIASGPYSTCHGYFAAKNDCLANKGLLGVSLRKGDWHVHVYNTHLDSGRSPADRQARARQLEEAAQTINRLSRGVTLIVAGDFNLNRNDAEDQRLRATFLAATGLMDSGVRESDACEFGCKGLDSIFYRGSDIVAGRGEHAHAPGFVDATGRGLSDHPPLRIDFSRNTTLLANEPGPTLRVASTFADIAE